MKQDVTVELFYDSQWNNHTSNVLVRDEIIITRGAQDESQQPTPTNVSLTFNSWDFNPGNSTSALSGKIGRNTPLRVSVGTDIRFVGEVSSWTPRQSLGVENQQPDRWVEVVATGITRRLGQGSDPLQSALRRLIPTSSNISAYWPLDGGQLSTVGRPVVGTSEFRPLSGNTRFGSDDLTPWLETGLSFTENATMRGDVSMPTVPGIVTVRFVSRRDVTGGPTVLHTVGNTDGGGNTLIATFTPPDTVELQLNHNGSFVDSNTGTSAEFFDGQVHHVQLGAGPSDPSAALLIDGKLITFVDGFGTPLTGISQVRLSYNPGTGGNPMTFGHLAVWKDSSLTADQLRAYRGYTGEHAGQRIERIADEQDLLLDNNGDLDDTIPLGPQYPDGLTEIFRESAEADDGLFTDSRANSAEVYYRTGRSRYNQSPVLELNYANGHVAPPLNPVIDDESVRNDVTVQRRDGGLARAVDQFGPLGVDTIGRYDTQLTVNCMSDVDAGNQAGWRLHLGTINEIRFPQITVDLDASPDLVEDASTADVADLITIDNLPSGLTPDLANLHILGYTETIGSHRRRITFTCSPERPYQIAEVEHADYSVVGSSSATLDDTDGLTTTETAVTINCGAGPDWVHESDFPIIMGGERMTLTAVGSPSGTFPNRLVELTVVRSVNGVVKTHANGVAVRLFHESYIGL